MEEKWIIRIMEVSSHEGVLSRVYAHVLGSDQTVRGTLQLRGASTPHLLALLQMHSLFEVIDCSRKVRSNADPRQTSLTWPRQR